MNPGRSVSVGSAEDVGLIAEVSDDLHLAALQLAFSMRETRAWVTPMAWAT